MNLKEELLKYYNLSNEEYLNYTINLSNINVDNSDNFYEINDACQLILDYVKKQKNIYIFGDYDVDGIMSVSILVNTFLKLGIKVNYYIPNRKEGYGISFAYAKEIMANCDLLITVDNGVKQNEALNYLKENNVKVILTDHHDYIESELPAYDYFIHPFHQAEKEFSCGAYVAFMLSIKLLKEVDYYLLSLAAAATISDLMPLNNLHNRNIVRMGIKYLEKHKEHPFYLLTNKAIDEYTLGFVISPKINAYGRMIEDKSINDLVKLFINENYHTKLEIAMRLEKVNNERKDLVNKAVNEALLDQGEGIISVNENLLYGLVGLLAARFMNSFHKVTISFTHIDGLLKGSARSFMGCSLSEFINENQDIIVSGGGHALAGGITIKETDYLEFKNRFFSFIKNHPIIETKEKYIKIEPSDLTLDNYNLIKLFSPFGTDFEEVNFLIVLPKKQLYYLNEHVKATLSKNASLIGFNLKAYINQDEISFLGHLRLDSYKKNCLSFMATKII